MRIVVFIACAGLLAQPVDSLARCRFGVEQANHIETRLAPWKSKAIQAINSKLGRRDGEYYLYTVYSSMGRRVEFDAQTPLELTFANGRSLSLQHEATGSSRRTLLGLAINNRKAETVFFVDREAFELFGSSALQEVIMHFRHDGVSESETFDIGDRQQARFMEYANCVLDHE